MLIANNSEGERIVAWKAEKNDGIFFCPECMAPVILRKGRIRVHHFAHTASSSCKYAAGESEQHLRIKKTLYEILRKHPRCSRCEMERRLNGVRPDVSLYVEKTAIAIELQRSAISTEEIAERTQIYNDLNIAIIWVIPPPAPRNQSVCRPKSWQRFLHAMYWGRLYYWCSGAYVRPIHLSPYEYWIDEREWYDGYEMQSAGGYGKTSKVKKVASLGPLMHLAEDFGASKRSTFEMRDGDIPQCRLWIDTSPKWWE